MALADKNIANENFWLNLAVENIYSSFEKRATSVKNLKEVIAWTFGIFSGAGFVGSVFGTSIKNFNQTSLWCFAVAFFLLTLAYALASQAQYPVAKTYHPNDVSDISRAFGETVKTQTFYFKLAAGTTMAGFFFLALGVLFLFSHAKDGPPVPAAAQINPLLLRTSVEKKGDNYFIPVTVLTSADAKINLTIAASRGKDSSLMDAPFVADTSGRFYFSYAIPEAAKTYDSFMVRVGISSIYEGVLTERSSSLKIWRP